MEYSCLQGMALDVPPLMEERSLCSSGSSLGSFQQLAYSPHFPAISWSTTDPTLLVTNHGDQPVFNRFEFKAPGAAGIGGDACCGYDASFLQPNVLNNGQLNLPMDVMATISSNTFSLGGDAAAHSQWLQMCSLLSDQYYNDSLPQLISDSAVGEQRCVYTSSSDYLHEADSSGSSERDRPLSGSCLLGSFSGENNWRNSDALNGNLGGSVTAISSLEHPDESSSVVADREFTDASGHPLSLVRKHRTSARVEFVPPVGPVSWMSPTAIESESNAMVSSVPAVNHVTTLDPLLDSASMLNGSGLPTYKRQRACYSLETIPSRATSQSLQIPSLARSISPRRSDYPLPPLNAADSLYKDLHLTGIQVSCPPKPAAHELVGSAFGSRRAMDPDIMMLNRKQNATSIEPQSVAARHRRKKISERVRILEKLIPGGNKMDTASMLDEAIEYVKFLQLQVQILESLGEIPEGSLSTTSSFQRKENTEGGKGRFAQRIGSFESHISQTCSTLQQGRSSTSPLILSEILQQQLFKQKLCLVSLRQCPTIPRPCSTSGS